MTGPEIDTVSQLVLERRTQWPGEREISVLVRPDVALHQTKEGTARRHLMRGALRVLWLAIGDVTAAGAAAVSVRALVEWLSTMLGRGHIPYSNTAEFCAAVILALVLTGNYQRSDRPYSTLHLLVGSSMGVIVVCWSNFWARPTFGAVPIGVLLAVVTTCALFLTRGTMAAAISWLLPERRRLVPAIVVASAQHGETRVDSRSGYRVTGSVVLDRRHPELRPQELARLIREGRAESVIVLGALEGRAFDQLLEIGLNAGCEVLCSPPGFGVAGVRPSVSWRGPYALIQVQPPSLKAPQMFAKRCVDVLASCAALAISAPLALLVALAIRLDSPGPVLFSQARVGQGGRRFFMLKFRTMREGADTEKAQLAHLNPSGDLRAFKIPDDPRISRVGRILRRWSLDELPQFLNVIMGHMSLVGPRPVPEDDFVDYEEHHFRRLGAKPGITGLWQVSGRSAVADFEERVRMDTEYIDHWSLWLDFKILVMTIPAVLQRTGAY
ncbi:MAG TPA: exopolysaccharide biosynthesis polyprenyl glycosylphosphotransferase [Gemmatimonadaceae bacterium]|nr:exopolysaccharide biosynthesis polyprenyl glycosylphosphotransferase [Gemmatimonadaceae bacterium]